ncbi:MAG: glycerol-3-phosphate acyltransferase [bacterium]|nr:glycerol-3-phosphate acyltransferase [bacterium]
MGIIYVCIIFYLIGSFPTAYLLVRIKHKKKLTIEGTGNIGARNTFDVTNSKTDGIIVLIVDLLKGALPVLWFMMFSGFDPTYILITALFLLLGHNYSVWLKFKGGRGLATGAGILLVINFTVVLIWLLFFFILSKLVKNVHIATVIGLMLLPVSLVFLQGYILRFDYPSLQGLPNQFQFLFAFCSAICIVVLLKHISPVMELYKKDS